MYDSFESSSEPSQRRKTALAVIAAYEAWDIDRLMSYRSETCIHKVLPKSLNRPEMDNEAYKAFVSAMMPYFRNFHVTVHDLIEDAAQNKICIWASSTADTDIGPYANEYMVTLHFNEAGDKVDRFFEFVDSANSVEFYPRLREYVAQ